MYRQQNHQREARPWTDSNHRSPVYKTGALTTMLQSHVTDVSRSTFTDSYGQKTKRANEDKVYAECTESKKFKDNRGHWADLNHRSPVFSTRTITTMLESRIKERRQK